MHYHRFSALNSHLKGALVLWARLHVPVTLKELLQCSGCRFLLSLSLNLQPPTNLDPKKQSQGNYTIPPWHIKLLTPKSSQYGHRLPHNIINMEVPRAQIKEFGALHSCLWRFPDMHNGSTLAMVLTLYFFPSTVEWEIVGWVLS